MVAIEVPQTVQISGRGKNGEGKRVASAICQRRANRCGIDVKEIKERRSCFVRYCLLHSHSKGQAKREWR